jgi:hypothetical protein
VPLDGNQIDGFLRLVRVHLDAFQSSLEEALAIVPEEARERVRSIYLEEMTQPIRRARVLSGTGGPRPWFKAWDPSEGYHWRRLRQYLLDYRKRSQAAVDSLDDSSDKVLSHLEDPRSTGKQEFRVRGLVLGHVQSGKTANITSLIAKSADLGYKLVVVLSGLHNELRRQTQRRLSLELGLVPSPPGVGLPKPGEQWLTLTQDNYHGDFRPGTTGPSVLQGNDRVIAVMKKNASVLRRMVKWIDGRAPADLPVLIIDDEADQASINTGGNRRAIEENLDLEEADFGEVPREQETDPSTINGLIRELITCFQRVSYVAYTATPFANVLIDPEAYDSQAAEDLYPKDFIVSLPVGAGYVGAEALFGRDALEDGDNPKPGLDVIEPIPEHDRDSLIPKSRSSDDFEPTLPESLKTALMDFVLATAAKVSRLGEGIASMLIHTSHRTSVQNLLSQEVDRYVQELRRTWRYDRPSIFDRFRHRWDDKFRPIISSLNAANDLEFEEIEDHITRIFREPSGLKILVLNNTSDDELDYENNAHLKVILIGGNKLSRGLTLEDLLVSYYVRDVTMYDTLLQMGRWFGYRSKYVDLTKLWTTEDLVSRFRHLALVEEEIRDQIDIYEQSAITPREFGLKIRTHPAMLVTAKNKMGSATVVEQSYAGELLQTTRFRLGQIDWLTSNLTATQRLFEKLGIPDKIENGRPGWQNINWNLICEFLEEYKTAQDAESIDAPTIKRYIERQAVLHHELTNWIVSVRCLPNLEADLGVADLHIESLPSINAISRSRLKVDKNSIGALTSPARVSGARRQGDEEVGLSDEQIDLAREGFEEKKYRTLGHALRGQRNKAQGLLLVYPISPRSKSRTVGRENIFDDPTGKPVVIGVAFSFPPSESGAAVQYLAGPAGRSRTIEDELE